MQNKLKTIKIYKDKTIYNPKIPDSIELKADVEKDTIIYEIANLLNTYNIGTYDTSRAYNVAYIDLSRFYNINMIIDTKQIAFTLEEKYLTKHKLIIAVNNEDLEITFKDLYLLVKASTPKTVIGSYEKYKYEEFNLFITVIKDYNKQNDIGFSFHI